MSYAHLYATSDPLVVYYSVKTPEEAHENMASFYSVLIRCVRDQEHQDQLLGVHTSF